MDNGSDQRDIFTNGLLCFNKMPLLCLSNLKKNEMKLNDTFRFTAGWTPPVKLF